MKLLASIAAASVLCISSQSWADPERSSFWTDGRTLWGSNSFFGSQQIVVPLLPSYSPSQPKVAAGTNLFNFGTNLFRMPTNLTLPFVWGTNRLITLPAKQLPSPGVYKTEPYACIVVVPGPHADDRMVIGRNAGIESKMPIINPDVTFVPWPQGIKQAQR